MFKKRNHLQAENKPGKFQLEREVMKKSYEHVKKGSNGNLISYSLTSIVGNVTGYTDF